MIFVNMVVPFIVAKTFFCDILKCLVISIYLKSETHSFNFGKIFLDQAEREMSLSALSALIGIQLNSLSAFKVFETRISGMVS